MVLANVFVAVVWSYSFYFFIVFMFLSLFTAVFINTYEETISKYGYPEDFQDKARWGY